MLMLEEDGKNFYVFLIEYVDFFIRQEMVVLLENDVVKYFLIEEEIVKDKKKGVFRIVVVGRLLMDVLFLDDFEEEDINEVSEICYVIL